MRYFTIFICLISVSAYAQNYKTPIDSLNSFHKEAPVRMVNEPDSSRGAPNYEFVPELPQPKISLQEFISSHVKYPELAVKTGVQGTVYVKLVVLANGNIDTSTVQVAKGLKNGGAGLNDEAIRVVKLIPEGSFEPGKNKGQPVNVWISIPMRFSMDYVSRPKKEKKKKKDQDDE